jgi:hypothetical protein
VRIPIKNHIDIWVGTLAEEKAFHKKHNGQPVDLYKVSVEEK